MRLHLILPNRQASNHIVDDPSRIVTRQPPDDWRFVDNIVCCGCWRCFQSSIREPDYPVPRVVRSDILDRLVDELHDEPERRICLCTD